MIFPPFAAGSVWWGGRAHLTCPGMQPCFPAAAAEDQPALTEAGQVFGDMPVGLLEGFQVSRVEDRSPAHFYEGDTSLRNPIVDSVV